VLTLLKNILITNHEKIAVRARVNRMHNITGPERTDGLVMNVQGGVAYVVWPNGDTTQESVKHLVPIVE